MGITLVLNARGFDLIPACVSVSGNARDPGSGGPMHPVTDRSSIHVTPVKMTWGSSDLHSVTQYQEGTGEQSTLEPRDHLFGCGHATHVKRGAHFGVQHATVIYEQDHEHDHTKYNKNVPWVLGTLLLISRSPAGKTSSYPRTPPQKHLGRRCCRSAACVKTW